MPKRSHYIDSGGYIHRWLADCKPDNHTVEVDNDVSQGDDDDGDDDDDDDD
ncbi:MAG: hypothetical protein AAGA83_17605 [Cyanobacteria bacterium P01_F01_bin.116]